ncbi:MAG: hydrogenase formation protein HypD [Nitrospinae bacterium]|nr:hydrogenase formation protein HypD [Nitrospinota bacterium]
MKYIDEFRDGALARKLVADLEIEAERLSRRVTLMEVCGTHTMAIYRHGLKPLFPEKVRLVSGPGCPVCVTPAGYVDMAITLARTPGVIITTFGDMLKVPGSQTSLVKERGAGRDVRVVYSPMDAVETAKSSPDKEVVFLGVGFETTAPSVAAAILTAKREGVKNFTVLASHKVMPEPMEALTKGELKIDGYICPAHVSAIIGERGYRRLAEVYGVPCVITGFEPLDMLRGVIMLVRQIAEGRAVVENEYFRVVKPEGNVKAQAILADVFEKSNAVWRGLGPIPDSGLAISPRYESYDAMKKFKLSEPDVRENPACLCGEILKGLKEPLDCGLFATACTPENPVGACMVSSEGTCAAEFRYGERSRANA